MPAVAAGLSPELSIPRIVDTACPTDWRPGHRVRPPVQFSGPGQKEVVGLIPVLVKKCLPAQTVAAPRF